MPENKGTFREVLPKQGMLYQEDIPTTVLCKPKLMPLKSVTLEKLEKMQKDAQETVKQQELMEQQEQSTFMAQSAMPQF
ncbi:BBSome-interacting protein 1-like [Glandiceps talaboti]